MYFKNECVGIANTPHCNRNVIIIKDTSVGKCVPKMRAMSISKIKKKLTRRQEVLDEKNATIFREFRSYFEI